MNNLSDEILNTIKYAIENKTINCDRTFKSVIKRVTPKGYVILDETGNERTVQCCIPNVELRPMQSVYVKIPMGRLNDIHIVGVAGNTSSSSSRSRRR